MTAVRNTERARLAHRITLVATTLIGLGCLAGVLVPAGLGWDFANFYDAGRRVVAGEAAHLYDPKAPIGGLPPQGTTGFFGTPLSALLYTPLAAFAPTTALVLFKLADVAALLGALLVLWRFYRSLAGGSADARATFTAWFAVLSLVYQPFWTIFRVGGQTTPFVFLALTLALVGHVRGRFWRSAIGVAVAALIKPSLAPTVLLLLAVAGPAYAWRSVVAFLAAALASVVLLGWPAHEAFLALMRRSSQVTYAWYFNSSVFILFDNWRLAAGPESDASGLVPIVTALQALVRLGAVMLIGSLLWSARRAGWSPAAWRHLQFQMAVLLFLFVSLTVWEHYLALLFPFLAYLVAAREALGRAVLRLVVVIAALSLLQNLILIDWLRAHVAFTTWPRLMGIAILKSAPLTVTVYGLCRHRRAVLASHTLAIWPQLAGGKATASS